MRTVICGLGALALVIAGFSVASLYGDTTTPSVQAAGITLGVDVATDGNDASHLGTIVNCKRVEVGNDFDVDVYITDVIGLQGWDAFFAFDGSLLTLTGQQQMMISGFAASDPVPDSGPHKHFLGYGARSKVDGSGVLVRLTFHAYAPGVSTASISYNPLGPHLNPGSDPIAFNGPIFAASIAIGQACPSTPVVTDSPQPTATPSPSPLLGDADCNGLIGLPDVVAALAYASKLGSGSACQGRADADCDGFVTATDVLRILRFLAGDALPQPAGCVQIGSPLSG